jgi:hypothetical protein
MGAGYGQMPPTPVGRLAHRWAYTHFIGNIPEGMVVMHICDNRICCNPHHLKLGTQQDNLKDMNIKKRHGVHPKRCTLEKLNEILWLKQQNIKVEDIARAVGYNKRTVFRLIAESKQKESIYHALNP